MKKLIILDRDGVINQDSKDYIKSPTEWIAIPGSLEAIASLNKAGFTVVVATNQSGLARGYYTIETLHKIHEKMHADLASVGGKIEHIVYCPHGPEDNCDCRKPKPGMLHQIAQTYNISLRGTYFVGDSLRDIEAAQNAGATPILVLSGNGEKTLKKYPLQFQAIPYFTNLAAFAEKLTSTALC